MQRDELERLSKPELIELVLRLQRPAKTSRTSSKPPSTDPKERREHAKPGGAKPGHEGHSRTLSEPDRVVDHAPHRCPCCRLALSPDLPSAVVSVHERVELPEIKPAIEHHRRLAVQCPGCGTRVVAALPPATTGGTPFGPRLHAVATYLKTFQSLSYERLQATLADLFGLPISQGGLMNLLRRAQGRFRAGREQAVAALRRAEVVASDETGVRIEGGIGYHWVFRCTTAVVHRAAPTRAASVVEAMMGGHKPAVWLSDRYSAQQGHGLAQQTCLAHLARDVAYALEASDDPAVPFRLKLWLASAFELADGVSDLAASTVAAKRRALERRLSAILAAPTTCDLAAALQAKLRRARDQLLTFADWPGRVAATNNACERALRPAVIQRKSLPPDYDPGVTNGYRAMWAAAGEADVRTVVDTARLKPGTGVFGTILQTVTA
jgi:transposase